MSNQTAEELEAEGEQNLTILLEDAFNSEANGWTFFKEIDGVKIYTKKQEGLSLNAWMGVGLVPCSPEELWRDIGINGFNTRKGWDKMFHGGTFIEEVVTGKLLVANTIFTAPWPVYWRDFVACQYERELDGDHAGYFVDLQWSIERTECPPVSKYVRGQNNAGGFVFCPVEGEPNMTRLIYTVRVRGSAPCSLTVQVDPKGWLPQWVVDKVSLDQPMVVAEVRKYWESK